MKFDLTDIFEAVQLTPLDESKEVDGKHIIGKMAGTFFVPNGTSRNGRHYTESLWKRQISLPEIQEKLKNRNMYGTIGHK